MHGHEFLEFEYSHGMSDTIQERREVDRCSTNTDIKVESVMPTTQITEMIHLSEKRVCQGQEEIWIE
jgi:hypothetical protein